MFASALSLTAMSRLVSTPHLEAPENDESLEQANQIFWSSLIAHVQASISEPVTSVLDIGCHQGGLLAQLASVLHPQELTGIEPSTPSRERATFRLRTLASLVSVLPPDRWNEVVTGSVDLITCHEVLHLIEDIGFVFSQIVRTLKTNGTAFIVAGCHAENPVWTRWKVQLEGTGQIVFDRSPFDILQTGLRAGLKGAIRPLRRDGWILYDPDQAALTYSSAGQLLDHHYRQKLLFRFIKQS
jgi:SAM-dependent methyltransferase